MAKHFDQPAPLEEGRREVEDLAGLEHGRIHLALSNMERSASP